MKFIWNKKFISNRKLFFYFTLIVCSIDCLLPFLLAPFCAEYNHLTMVISVFGNQIGAVRYIYNTWMVCLGVSFLIIAIYIYKNYKASYGNAHRISLIGLLVITIAYAICDCIISGFFAIGDSKQMQTIPELLHGYGSAIGCTLFVLSGLFIGFLIWDQNRKCAILMWFDFLICLITFVLFVSAGSIQTSSQSLNRILSYEGLWQRISFLFMYLPYIFIDGNFYLIRSKSADFH